MPLYLYECTTCKREMTLQLPVADRDVPVGECEVCVSNTVRRVCGNSGGFRLGTKGNVSWAKGGYSSYLGHAVEAEKK